MTMCRHQCFGSSLWSGETAALTCGRKSGLVDGTSVSFDVFFLYNTMRPARSGADHDGRAVVLHAMTAGWTRQTRRRRLRVSVRSITGGSSPPHGRTALVGRPAKPTVMLSAFRFVHFIFFISLICFVALCGLISVRPFLEARSGWDCFICSSSFCIVGVMYQLRSAASGSPELIESRLENCPASLR